MRYRAAILGVPAILALLAFPISVAARPPTVRVGIVLDGPWHLNEQILGIYGREIRELLEGEFDARFPPEKQFVADWTNPSIQAHLERLLADPDVDIVLAMGPVASTLAAGGGPYPKPVIAPFVLEELAAGLPQANSGSGVRNLVYLSIPALIQRDLRVFHDVAPFEKLAILQLDAAVECIPIHAERLADELSDTGIREIIVVPVAATADDALQRIPGDTDAVYLIWLPKLNESEFQHLVRGLIERRLPSFSFLGRSDVEKGVMAGLIVAGLCARRARRVALITQRILLGEAPETLPVALVTERRLSINMSTVRAIDASPRWEILNEADLIQDAREDIERRLTLAGVMREAVRANLDLAAQRAALAAGQQEVNTARGALLPQIDARATAAFIDEDRAAASLGQAAEETYSGSLGLTQVLFSEPAWANVRIQGHLQRGREHELQALQLDIARDAALAYLDLLSARNVEDIHKNNLKVTRENLELARVRVAIGAAGPGEVYRWEAELAQSRRRVITANARRNVAEMQINRLLNRPLEEPFLPTETGIDDPEMILTLAPPFVYIGDRRNFQLLRSYLTGLALEESPDLQRLDAAIAAQRRFAQSQGRQYFAPSVALQGQLETVFDRQGAGAAGGIDAQALPPDAAWLGDLFGETPDDVNWQIGVNITLPLFRGGARRAMQQKARRELERLETQRAATAEKIEQNLRSALHLSGASYASIRLTREAADAAARTLELVSDAYARGAISILDLLDAQQAALVTEEDAANAVYLFLGDYIRVQRALGLFDVFQSAEEKRSRIDRLERYIVDHGGTLRVR